jgi:hypothetical protein
LAGVALWQGFTTDKKVWYAKDVLHMLDEYVRVQSLQPYIRLNTDVVAHEWSQEEDRWLLTVRTADSEGDVSTARMLIHSLCRSFMLASERSYQKWSCEQMMSRKSPD